MDETWRGKVGPLDAHELETFLAEGRLCRLACLRDDDWPYVVPCWFEWNEGSFWIVPRKRSVWARYIQRDPRVSLSIDEEASPYRKVQVIGRAHVVEEPNIGGQWVEIARRMSVRYLGQHGPDYLIPTLNQPRWLLRVDPLSLTSWQGVAWHPRYTDSNPHPTPKDDAPHL